MELQEEQELLAALQAGHPAAKERFQREFGPTVEAISRWSRWGVPDSEREDLRQHLLARVYTELATFNGACRLEAGVVRLCISRGYDFLRKWIRRQGPLATALPGGDAPDVWLDKQTVEVDPAREAWKMELGAAAWKQVDALAPECREILTAFHRDEKSYEEIAGQIRAKLGTVGSRLSRCLEHLRKLLRDSPDFREFFSSRRA